VTRPDLEYSALAAKAVVRELLWYLTCQHVQGDARNVLLFATRRGGSTFAMEIIGANRGIRTLDQPLETQSRSLTAAQTAEIPRFHQGQITSIDASTHERMLDVMQKLGSGRAVINAPTRVWRRDVSWRSNRLVLKITDAKPIIDWFHRYVDADIVYLTRHPIPQAISCLRNNWTLTVDAHLRDPTFVAAHVPDAALARAHDVMRSGTMLQRFVVNWALENAAPMHLLPERSEWTHIRYESCVLDPAGTLSVLADRLGLADADRMQRVLHRPSVSSRISTDATRRKIEQGRGADVLNAWRDEVDPSDERWCEDTLAAFGIDIDVLRHR
jgi:hypothetical protein